MITLIRGRKRLDLIPAENTLLSFTDDNPDKGTETSTSVVPFTCPTNSFTDDNPDKGTETLKSCQLN